MNRHPQLPPTLTPLDKVIAHMSLACPPHFAHICVIANFTLARGLAFPNQSMSSSRMESESESPIISLPTAPSTQEGLSSNFLKVSHQGRPQGSAPAIP